MVDIHSHILWGLDDGAETLADSLEMVRMAAASGTTDIVATPHASHDYRFDPAIVEQRVAELREACGGSPEIHYGCDFHLMFENIEDALRAPDKYTINHGRYLMVEFPDAAIAPNMPRIFLNLRMTGIVPIITHPERNPVLQKSMPKMEEFVRQGCLVQITAQSLGGLFGKHAEQSAWKLMESGMAHFVASDAHETERRTPDMRDARGLVVERMGEDWAQMLFEENPAAVIKNELLSSREIAAEPPRRKKWHGLW